MKPLFLGKKYFAFKGAKHWLRWYFTIPAFRDDIVGYDEVLQLFLGADEVNDGEIAIDIKGTREARKILIFLDEILDRNS